MEEGEGPYYNRGRGYGVWDGSGVVVEDILRTRTAIVRQDFRVAFSVSYGGKVAESSRKVAEDPKIMERTREQKESR